MLFQQRWQSRQPASRRIPGNARIDHLMRKTELSQALVEQPDPAVLAGESVTGAQAIAERQDDRGLRKDDRG